MPRENKTKYAVLGLLANRPGSGYDIKKRFEDYVGKFWSESYGQIYPIAKDLVEEGFATCSTEHTTGRPDRYVFSITEKGLEELKKWLVKSPDPHKERLEVLLRLMCGAHISIEENIRLVQRFKDEWLMHIASYSEIEKTLKSTFDNEQQLPYWMMGVSCGMHLGKAYMEWCDETIEKLKNMKEKASDVEESNE